jgi:hypothetical protein
MHFLQFGLWGLLTSPSTFQPYQTSSFLFHSVTWKKSWDLRQPKHDPTIVFESLSRQNSSLFFNKTSLSITSNNHTHEHDEHDENDLCQCDSCQKGEECECSLDEDEAKEVKEVKEAKEVKEVKEAKEAREKEERKRKGDTIIPSFPPTRASFYFPAPSLIVIDKEGFQVTIIEDSSMEDGEVSWKN